jgi:hypothetical protein
MKNDTYYFHQTPEELCKILITKIPLVNDDIVLEPFKGEGSFYNNFPTNVKKEWCEIEEGKDYKDYTGSIDWIISNPPFKLDIGDNNRVNSFYSILEYFSTKVNKGIAFLGNDYCFSTLTPLRMKKLNDNGLYLQGYTICNVKKWRGRYFFMVFNKIPNNNIGYIEGSY